VQTWTPTLIETTPDYERYPVTGDGISPRGVPGYGTGLVVVDSDEHTPDGHLTEDLETRVQMMDKRLKKFEGIQSEVLEPISMGKKHAKKVIVGWGSTKTALSEAVTLSDHSDLRYLHFKQVWPLPENIGAYFAEAEEIIVVENNATGQFADQLKLAGVGVTGRILKYNGEPFSVEELVEYIEKL
jgi:2-oxoglutarate ferredoxin oxidoreductase subunit alpha